jgi:ribosomal protein RSM22 (predicted rRNA methylase)
MTQINIKKHYQILSDALENLYKRSGLSPSHIMGDVERLSNRYLGGGVVRVESEDDALAYALYFMPEHFLKPFWALSELIKSGVLKPGHAVTAKDCGSGPGTATWALCEAIKTAGHTTKVRCTLQDNSEPLLGIARRLSEFYRDHLEPSFVAGDFVNSPVRISDLNLVMFCNTLSENSGPDDNPTAVIKRELESLSPGGVILVVEPATERGIETVTRLRKNFADGCILPCPAPGPCPMIEKLGRSCHFDIPTEVPRELQRVVTAMHRKNKFCVLAIAKNPAPGGISPNPEERPDSGETRVYRVLSPFLKQPWGREAEGCDGRNLSRLILKKVSAREDKKAMDAINCGDLIRVRPERVKGDSVHMKEIPGVLSKFSEP